MVVLLLLVVLSNPAKYFFITDTTFKHFIPVQVAVSGFARDELVVSDSIAALSALLLFVLLGSSDSLSIFQFLCILFGGSHGCGVERWTVAGRW